MNKKNRPATGAEAPAAPPLGHQGDLGAAGTFSLIPWWAQCIFATTNMEGAVSQAWKNPEDLSG